MTDLHVYLASSTKAGRIQKAEHIQGDHSWQHASEVHTGRRNTIVNDVTNKLQLPTLAVNQQILQNTLSLLITPLLILTNQHKKYVLQVSQ